MNIILIYFLPAIFLLGIITSYEDIKEGKIRNKWTLSALIYAFVVYLVLIISYYSKGTLRVPYLVELCTSIIFAMIIGFGMWLGNLWTPGDAKLFMAYTALIPLSVYGFGYVKYFPAITLLINTFVPIFIFFFLLLVFKTNLEQKKEALKPLLAPKNLINSVFSLFAIFWFIELMFPAIGIEPNYFSQMIVSIAIFSILQKTLKEKTLGVAIVISSIRLIVDKSVYNLLFFEKIFGLFFFWIVFKGAIINLGQMTFSKETRIEELKPKLIPAEVIYEDNKRYFKEGQEHQMVSTKRKDFLGLSYSGLTRGDIEKLKQLKKERKLKFTTLKIKQTMPFAPFMLFGVLLTILSKGNFIIWVSLVIAKFL
ncbi:hypothetical protein KY360_00585 [Candidatus Woesearchaeota archaeon]|nr:hypothetical protein [Candidatus Woesearchaeota archaeon]